MGLESSLGKAWLQCGRIHFLVDDGIVLQSTEQFIDMTEGSDIGTCKILLRPCYRRIVNGALGNEHQMLLLDGKVGLFQCATGFSCLNDYGRLRNAAHRSVAKRKEPSFCLFIWSELGKQEAFVGYLFLEPCSSTKCVMNPSSPT